MVIVKPKTISRKNDLNKNSKKSIKNSRKKLEPRSKAKLRTDCDTTQHNTDCEKHVEKN